MALIWSVTIFLSAFLSAGQVVTTAKVVVPVTMAQFQYQDPAGKAANYHLSPTPASITGSFVG